MKIEYLYGRRPAAESLRAGRRVIRRLVIADSARENLTLEQLGQLAAERGVRVDSAPRGWLDSKTRGANHQGVVLEAAPYPYVALDALLDPASLSGEPPLLLLLDLIQDVQNVGTLLRTAEAVGVHGVVLQERRAAAVTPAVVSASSGAVEHLKVAQVTNLVQAMKTLKEADVWLAGLDQGPDTTRFDQANLRGALGLVVGSEGAGLRRLVRETCDFLIELPMRGQVESLNAAVAGSVALYAAWAARGFE
ncbi:MAG: 23S rRNA (guanosine(2251)-2'-O)-methyltransferase RlmB [Chloroflexota bacterium]